MPDTGLVMEILLMASSSEEFSELELDIKKFEANYYLHGSRSAIARYLPANNLRPDASKLIGIYADLTNKDAKIWRYSIKTDDLDRKPDVQYRDVDWEERILDLQMGGIIYRIHCSKE